MAIKILTKNMYEEQELENEVNSYIISGWKFKTAFTTRNSITTKLNIILEFDEFGDN